MSDLTQPFHKQMRLMHIVAAPHSIPDSSKCMVNLLIQVCTNLLDTAKAGQTATALIISTALLS